ncbi:MAG: LysE family translocator [Proteobacteria bacterium]|nr:LysE family translocator [Pseudomonadota bacterium]
MLPDYAHLILFLTAMILLNLTPGSDVLYVAGQSLVNGKHGIYAALGTGTGGLIYVAITSAGLAAVIRQSLFIFNFIKIAGGVYLLYLAWKTFFNNQNLEITANPKQSSLLKSYYRGILNNLLNPKVGIFFITFLPQFTDPARGKIYLQLLSLGLCFMISGTIVNIAYALLVANLKKQLFKKAAIKSWLNKATAAIFCILAFKILTSKQS